MHIHFMSQADEKFFKTIDLSIRQAARFYPHAPFYVYDWGFTVQQAAQLRQRKNVVLVDWKDRFVEISAAQKIDWKATVLELAKLQGNILTILKRFILHYVLFRKELWGSLEEKVATTRHVETLLYNKPFCMLDCLNRHRGPMLCLDADAFLIAPVDELFANDFDVGVTVRRPHEISFQFNKCQVLNSGVLAFGSRYPLNAAFVRQWIQRMETTFEYLVEQTSLTRLIHSENPEIFEARHNTGTVTSPTGQIVVKTFPCDVYNFNWIEEGIDSSAIKILHLKGRRHSEDRLDEILRSIDL